LPGFDSPDSYGAGSKWASAELLGVAMPVDTDTILEALNARPKDEWRSVLDDLGVAVERTPGYSGIALKDGRLFSWLYGVDEWRSVYVPSGRLRWRQSTFSEDLAYRNRLDYLVAVGVDNRLLSVLVWFRRSVTPLWVVSVVSFRTGQCVGTTDCFEDWPTVEQRLPRGLWPHELGQGGEAPKELRSILDAELEFWDCLNGNVGGVGDGD